MSRFVARCCGILMALFILNPPNLFAEQQTKSTNLLAEQGKPKSCRMEQQCHWENFKKICVWVKVCR